MELATNDDWSYVQTARVFASTGHVVYNGWATAMLGWQIVWGALFIKLMGFSFLAARVSTIVVGAIVTLLLHRTLLRFGVSSMNAVAGTLRIVLSPLFLPMAASFMTDVPGIFCLLLCVYGCQRALRAASNQNALRWLFGSAALNILGGTVRQTAWLGALVIVPSTFWLLRRRRNFPVAGVCAWMFSVLSVFLLIRWFQHQPYSLPEHMLGGAINGQALRNILHALIYLALDVALFAMPVLAAWLPSLIALRRTGRRIATAVLLLLCPLLLWMDHHGRLRSHLPPWTPNIVSRYGIFWSTPSLGVKAEVLGPGFLLLATIALGVVLAAFLISRLQVRRVPTVVARLDGGALTLRETAVLLVPFCLAYVMALLPRAAFPGPNAQMYDRYYLPLVLMATILLLRLYEEEHSGSLPRLCWIVLSAFTLFSVAGTHDMFVEHRAIDSAIQKVRAAGVQATAMSGGWVYDGWTQIQAEGHINDARLLIPAGAYRPVLHPPLKNCNYWFGSFVPAIHPRYVVVAEPLACLERSQFPEVPFHTWLPPYTRRVLVEMNPAEH